MTEAGVTRQAEVAMGETSYSEPVAAPPPPPSAAAESGAYEEEASYDFADDGLGGLTGSGVGGGGYGGGAGRSSSKSAAKPTKSKKGSGVSSADSMEGRVSASRKPVAPTPEPAPAGPAIDAETLRRSTQASARSKQISGLTRIDVSDRVTVPEGSSTMVAVVNQDVEAEETFLYKPGGAGWGYENNPYRVVRFTNASKYVLEPGPISIYAGGSFVGEGLSEAVGAGASVTIPFAVEPNIMVSSSSQWGGEEMKLVRIVRGVLEVETWYQTKTTWDVRLQTPAERDVRVFVRHPRQGSNYELVGRPPGTEDLEGAYLVPIPVKQGGNAGKIELVEQTPSRTTITIWDGRALPLLDTLLQATKLDARMREQIQPIVELRREIGRIDTEIDGLERQQVELDERAQETRANLEAIKKDPAATTLRKKLNDRLDEFSKDADKIGRKIVELNSKRLDLKIKLEDALIELTMEAPKDEKKPSAVAPAAAAAGEAAPAGLGAGGDATVEPAVREGG
jgi:predicted  nucleic acid-binding Zn-ribbon protein